MLDFFGQLVALPTPAHLVIAKYLLIVSTVTHFTYMGLLVGTSLISILFNLYEKTESNQRIRTVSRYLIQLPLRTVWLPLFLGVLPVFTSIILYQQLLFRPQQVGDFPPLPQQVTTRMLSVAVILLLAGLISLWFYKWSYKIRQSSYWIHILLGLAGNGLVLFGYLYITSGISLSLDPERWRYVALNWYGTYDFRVWLMHSWNATVRFMHFQLFALAVTGAVILWDYFKAGAQPDSDSGTNQLMRNLGSGLILAGVLGLPVMNYWNVITTQYEALNSTVYLVYYIQTAALCIIAIWAYKLLIDPNRRASVLPLAGLVIFFTLFNVADGYSREEVLRDYNGVLHKVANQAWQASLAESEGNGDAGKPSAKMGEELSKSKGCVACHSIDGSKRIGPSWKGIYGSNVSIEGGGTVTADDAYIKESILQPAAKIVKGYPNGMPPQTSLSEAEIASLIEYMKSLK